MNNKRVSKLFSLTVLEVKDEQDEKMESCFNSLSSQLKSMSDTENHDTLVAMVSQGQHDDVCLGLLYGLLTNTQLAPKFYRDLTIVSRDGLNLALTKVNWMIIEMFHKLNETAKNQLLWFIREAIRNSVNYMDNVCMNLLRVIAGGDISPRNTWLADAILTLLTENRAWMDKHPWLVSQAVFCFLRLITDHMSSSFDALRHKEIRFCMTLLRERFLDCMQIGRDLVRLLVGVARIPEFEKLWSDILYNPTVLSPQFTGLQQLLAIRTSRKMIASHLTVEMERRIHFFLNVVRFANQKHYLDWLQNQFLLTPESQSLRADWIRYVCCCIHPSNEVLASDVVPRWSFVAWIISTCTNTIETQLCKLAVFFDWLSYDAEKDSIMNIEPGILLMYHSMVSQPAMMTSLLDFLCRITVNFYPPLASHIKRCVHASIRQILEKRVVASITPLFDHPKLDRELKTMVQEVFGEFRAPKETPSVEETKKLTSEDVLALDAESIEDPDTSIQNGEFSDDESSPNLNESVPKVNEQIEPAPMVRRERRTTELNIWDSDGDLIHPFDDPQPGDISEALTHLDEIFAPLIEDLQKISEDNMTRCDRMQRFLIAILSKDELDQEQAEHLSECLCGLFRPFFARKVFPEEINCESDLDDSINVPFFVIFRNLCLTPDDDASRHPILLLLAEVYTRQPRIGYLLLYFLKATSNAGDKMTAYKDLCDAVNEDDLDTMLIKDLTLCQTDDHRLFFYLIPEIYRKFSQIALSNAELMHLLVSNLDALQLQDLIAEIVQGSLHLFKKESFTSLLNTSLRWETIEQYFFWQLIAAEEIPLDWIIPIIPKLEYPKHVETMTNVTLIGFKQLDKEPNTALVRSLLLREPYIKNDFFTASNIKVLIDGFEDKMASIIAAQLSKSASAEPVQQSKGKRTVAAKGLSLDQILGHLDVYRQFNKLCHSFFSKDIIQSSLAEITRTASESLKSKFSELFAMMEILDTVRDGRVFTRRGRKVVAAAHNAGDSSDDEKVTKPAAKKRKKVVESDSD